MNIHIIHASHYGSVNDFDVLLRHGRNPRKLYAQSNIGNGHLITDNRLNQATHT